MKDWPLWESCEFTYGGQKADPPAWPNRKWASVKAVPGSLESRNKGRVLGFCQSRMEENTEVTCF